VHLEQFQYMLQRGVSESYVTSPSRAFASSPRRNGDMFTMARTSADVEVTAAEVFSPRALTQTELSTAVFNGVVDGISRLGLVEKHMEVVDTIRRLPSPTVDIQPITRALAQLLTLKDSHSEVLEAITNVSVAEPDLSPILEAISSLANHKEMNVVVDPPDLFPVQQMMEEMKVELRGAIADIRKDLQSDMSILQQEVLKNRDDARGQAEVIVQELQTVPQELEELRKEIKKLTLSVDSNEVMAALKRLPDAEAISKSVLEKSRKLFPDRGDFSELSDIVKRMKREPDLSPLLSTLESGQQQILDTVGRIRLDNTPVLEALRKIEWPDSEAIGRVMTDRLRKHNVATGAENAEILNLVRRIPDNAEVLESMRSLGRAVMEMQSFIESVQRSLPDQNAFASAVCDRLRRANLQVDSSEVLQALSGIRLAVTEVSRFDLTPIMQEIAKMSSISDQRLGGLQREIWHLREGLAAMRVVIPPQQAMVNQVVQSAPVGAVGLQRMMSAPSAIGTVQTVVQPPVQVCATQTQEYSPRVVAELYGPKVTLPSVPISETVQSKAVPTGTTTIWQPQELIVPTGTGIWQPQETLLSTVSSGKEVMTVSETVMATDGYTSPRRLDSPRSPTELSSPNANAQDVALSREVSSRRLGPPRGYHGQSKAARFPGV
jgi:hypothetical protein